MTRVAVLVLSHARDRHLVRQQDALRHTSGWDEGVVAFVNQDAEPWREPPPRVRVLHYDAPGLSLAGGRNAAAAAASADILVFLDVDCLPDRGTLRRMADECASGRVVMADPWYLPPTWEPPADPAGVAEPHRDRSGLGYGASTAWHMFWSLGFAMRADDFRAVGGFDEGYSGYGGEDTDFAFRCRDAGMELFFSRARVFHQAHPVYRPPLQHVESIAVNARRFHARWGVWPMDGWLRAFADRGYIAWSDRELRVLRRPDDDEIRAARIEGARY